MSKILQLGGVYSNKAKQQLAIILRYYTSINPNTRRWACMALYMWWAFYSTYGSLVRSKRKKPKSGPSSASSSTAVGTAISIDGTTSTTTTAAAAASALTNPSTSSAAAAPVDEVPSATSSRKSRRGGRKGPRVEVDAVFFERLGRILAIVLPSNKGKLVLESFFLVFRVCSPLFSNVYISMCWCDSR